MFVVRDRASLSRALSLPIDPKLKRLLIRRGFQLGGEIADQARFVVVEPGDTLAALEAQLSFSILQNLADGSEFEKQEFTPGWEWSLRHDFGWELCFIFTDDGFAHVVLVPDAAGMDPKLIEFCATYTSEHV